MNTIAVVGTLTDQPVLLTESGEAVAELRIAVPRHARGGHRQPGVVHVRAYALGSDAEACRQMRPGDRLALAGRFEDWALTASETPQVVLLADQLEHIAGTGDAQR